MDYCKWPRGTVLRTPLTGPGAKIVTLARHEQGRVAKYDGYAEKRIEHCEGRV